MDLPDELEAMQDQGRLAALEDEFVGVGADLQRAAGHLLRARGGRSVSTPAVLKKAGLTRSM